jgi:ADP-heptose:LPS heptosyltransferase
MRQFLFSSAPNTIAIFRALQLGDLLCTVPTFRALRAGFPHARIDLIGLPWAGAFTARFSHYLDDFIEFPGWPGLPEQAPRIERIPPFLAEMQRRQYDLILQMQGDGSITNPLVSLFGARKAAGYARPGSYRPNPDTFFTYPRSESEIRVFLRLVEMLGVPPQGEHLEFPVSEEEQRAFKRFLDQNSLAPEGYACLHPGARALERRWPPEKFAAVGDQLYEIGLQVVITGSEAEHELTRAVAEAMTAPAVDAGGQTGLGELALLISEARLLVSNDTGVSHLAAAFKTPSVILFRTSDPLRWRPLDHQRHRTIIKSGEISPQQVIIEARRLLKEKRIYAGISI